MLRRRGTAITRVTNKAGTIKGRRVSFVGLQRMGGVATWAVAVTDISR